MRFRNPYAKAEIVRAAPTPEMVAPETRERKPLRSWRINGVPELRRRRVEAHTKSEARSTFKALLNIQPHCRLPRTLEVYEG